MRDKLKKGQSEAFGLAIIVMLLVISAVIFFLRPHNNNSDAQKQVQNILNENFAFVILQSNVNYGTGTDICHPYTLLTLLTKYYRGDEVYCNNNLIDTHNAIYNYINTTLNQTLVRWRQPFNLTITGGNSMQDFHFGYPPNGGCNGKDRQGVIPYCPYGSDPTNCQGLYIEFYTC